MNRYRGNQALTLTFGLQQDDGTAITDASAVSYAVYDQSAYALLPDTPVAGFVANSASVTLALPATLNTLTGTESVLRTVELTITTPEGLVYQRQAYLLDPAERLAFLANSLLTEGEADLLATDLMLDAYWGATRDDKLAALKMAYEHVCKPTYVITHAWLCQVYGFDFDWQRYDWWDYYSPWWHWHYRDWIIEHLDLLDSNNWAKLPVQFQTAVKKAQVAEANYLLQGAANIERKRADGLMSETIGESSNMYRPGKPVLFPLGRDAMNHLRPFVKFQVRLSR